MYSTRRIETEDAGNLVKLWRQAWIATYAESLGADALSAMLSNLDAHGSSELLPGNGEQGYCAFLDDEIVGSAVFADRGGTGYLWGMYVSPLHHREGIGTLLLEDVSHASSSDRLEIRVLSSSQQALKFYRTQGFELTGQEDAEIMPGVHVNALIMARNINRSAPLPSVRELHEIP